MDEQPGLLSSQSVKNEPLEMQDIPRLIARLSYYGMYKGLLEEADLVPAMNSLCDLLAIEEPYFPEEEEQQEYRKHSDELDNPSVLLQPILDYAAEQGLIKDNTDTLRDLLDAKIMGMLMPRASEVVRQFQELLNSKGASAAVDWFFALSLHSNYIRMDRIRQNEYWTVETEFGELEITINLSKPEKDPKEIERERNLPAVHYPKCLLCAENAGYAGRLNHPGRQNHRIIPLSLAGSRWFLQYSPYVYYKEHCIILSEQHTPMKITDHTFERLLDFIGQFPFYFAGSNAALPIIGGSILSHDHYQGGRHTFAMEKAEGEQQYSHPQYPEVRIHHLRWPMPVIRISGPGRESIASLAKLIYAKWCSYSDASCGLLAYSTDNAGQPVPHNSVTPVARFNKAGEWEMDLVLRNNRTTEEHPMGLFHPHQEHHHIKKENIGLIEVMGLAVLPGRLRDELERIRQILTGERQWEPNQLDESLAPHRHWIETLIGRYGTAMDFVEAEQCMKKETGLKYLAVLSDAAVFKRNEEGNRAFERFMKVGGFVN